jgi:hypothetical protein
VEDALRVTLSTVISYSGAGGSPLRYSDLRQAVDPGQHSRPLKRPDRLIHRRPAAVRRLRYPLVAWKAAAILAVVEGVEKRPQDIHEGPCNGAGVLPLLLHPDVVSSDEYHDAGFGIAIEGDAGGGPKNLLAAGRPA